MKDHSVMHLRKMCNLATRQFLFEKAENILPFQLSYPEGYPQELGLGNPMKRLQIRLNWVRNALTKNVLGELQNHAFSLAARAPPSQYYFKTFRFAQW